MVSRGFVGNTEQDVVKGQSVEKHKCSCAPANTRANTVAILHSSVAFHGVLVS